MRGVSVIIPSKTMDNLVPCIESIWFNQPTANIVVIDDGLANPNDLSRLPDLSIIPGKKPFVFARNVNVGIEASGDDDVIALNDDALLHTLGGFRTLHEAALNHPEYGIIAATCNNVGNTNQWPQGIGLREEPRMVCFVCVYIPRTTIEKVGLLDERFVGYGMDDDDYCLRIRKAGLKIGIHDGCYVDHGSLTSTYRGDPTTPADYHPNLKRFKQKWGVDNFGNPV